MNKKERWIKETHELVHAIQHLACGKTHGSYLSALLISLKNLIEIRTTTHEELTEEIHFLRLNIDEMSENIKEKLVKKVIE